MKVVFLSNFYNHHQAPFSDAMDKLTDGKYLFVETEKITAERLQMGWGVKEYPPFVKRMTKDNAAMIQADIDEADVVIIGSAPISLIDNRIRCNKLVFRYSERWYKDKSKQWLEPIKAFYHYIKNVKYRNAYMLCASAYTAADCAKAHLYIGRTYKWGYFPEVKKYDIDKLIAEKEPTSILWAGRLIGWKHPDASIRVCARLKSEGYRFNLTIIGKGEMEQQLNNMIQEYGLSDCVHMAGSMKPEQVREYMEKAGIYLFTSDYNEGWGAVLNESMNSGCAVVASHAIGSVPFLIKDSENGLIYQSGEEDGLHKKIRLLLDKHIKQRELGLAAYNTINEVWNSKIAAERLIQLSDRIISGGITRDVFANGPCSDAKIARGH